MSHLPLLRPLLLAAMLCSSLPAAADAPAGVALISVSGPVSHQGTPLTAAGDLPALARLELKDGAAAFVLLPGTTRETRAAEEAGKAGATPSMAVAMTGDTTVELRGPEALVTLQRGNRIALSGVGTLLLRGWRVELAGSLLLHDFIVYVTHGQAKITGPADPDPGAPMRDVSTPLLQQLLGGSGIHARRGRSTLAMKAGQAARLELTGGISAAPGVPPPAGRELWRAVSAPAAWSPQVGAVKPESVERAQQLTRQQLQTQRETASCGCTESSGAGGPAVSSGAHVTPVERTASAVKVRIIGIPRRIQ